MITWSEHGRAVVQVAFCGIVTSNVFVPLCRVVVEVEPAGSPRASARTGWVGDQTGFVVNGGVQLVPAMARGSGSEVSVCVELAPSTRAMRYQPGCGIVAVTETETFCPGVKAVTILVAVPALSPRPVLGTAAHGPFF
jgi:hypothetical protein